VQIETLASRLKQSLCQTGFNLELMGLVLLSKNHEYLCKACHCEQREAIQKVLFAGLLRRFAPRNDEASA